MKISAIRRLALSVARKALSSTIAAPALALFVSMRLRPIGGSQPALRVLVFSMERWRQDVDALAGIPGLQLIEFPTRLVELINSLLRPVGTREHKATARQYFVERDIEILRDRDRHAANVARLLNWLRFFRRIDCIVTGSYTYIREIPFARACDYIGLPFVALHKEFTVLEPQHLEQRINEARTLGFRFFGSHLAVVSDTAKTLLSGAGVFAGNRITTIGLMRGDNLHRQAGMAAERTNRPTVVLFSFGTLTGPFRNPLPPLRSYYFSADESVGFTALFQEVHGGFAELALQHPEADFLIKPKNVEDWWISEIENAVFAAVGRHITEILNLRIVGDPAPELMRRSLANVVLNSTTVIESRLLNRNTILPIFAEAAGRHADMVYFRDFLDLFTTANSKQHLLDLLRQALEGAQFAQGNQERLATFLAQQIGNPDGRAAERFASLLHQLACKPDRNQTTKSSLKAAKAA